MDNEIFSNDNGVIENIELEEEETKADGLD